MTKTSALMIWKQIHTRAKKVLAPDSQSCVVVVGPECISFKSILGDLCILLF